MSRLPLLIPAAVAVALALPGAAHANNPTATADCDGLVFDMSSTIAGTVVTGYRDGALIFTRTATVQGQSIQFTIPNPDRNRAHTFHAIVDAPWDNEDHEFPFYVDVCDPPEGTLPPLPTSSTSLPPVTSTTVAPPTTTPPPVVVSTVPPTSTPATVVTTPGRPTPTTVPPTLPATGNDHAGTLLFAGLVLLVGALFTYLPRRGAK